MQRRTYRPDESFHRDARRKGLDRAAMLESKTRRKPRSLLGRILGAFFGR